APDEDAEEEDLASNDEYGDDDEDGDDYDDEDGDDDDEDGDVDGDDEPDDDGDGAIRAGAASEPAAVAAAPRADWTERRLCPDGACIGVIGGDGRCKVCGRPASGAPAEPPAVAEPAGAPAAAPAAAPVVEAAPVPATASPPATSEPDPAAGREACVVTGCGGYIGDAGRCMVCGRGAS
ncbi:MAG TPA: hypothetical protein VK607_11130, partial [Kofleriaceae bacterium]|nr:hypothetical protein [Kofleriaceae bacterium]